MRWLLWFVLAPQTFLLSAYGSSLGLPGLDCGALLCMFCALFADVRWLPGLLLGAAVGRAVVDEASLPVQVLVLGVPIAVLLPMRPLFYRDHWWWQALAAALCAVAVPKLAGLAGLWFGQPSASAQLDFAVVGWTAVLGPVLLWPFRRLPPLAAFVEERT